MKDAEINYFIHEKELLAVKHALRAWRIYIDNEHIVTILIDHESLKYLKTMRNPSKRLIRWLEKFDEYDLDIRYRKSSKAVVSDAINRRPDFIGEGPANREFVAMIRGIQEDE